jgi:hypothetical protein
MLSLGADLQTCPKISQFVNPSVLCEAISNFVMKEIASSQRALLAMPVETLTRSIPYACMRRKLRAARRAAMYLSCLVYFMP